MNEAEERSSPRRGRRSGQPAQGRGGAERPTRGPYGEVRWWEREAPGGDALMWEAVKAVQRRRQAIGLSVEDLRRRLQASGLPIRRETLSRVLNGRQPTTWPTLEALSAAVDLDLAVVLPHPDAFDLEDDPPDDET